MTDTDVNALVSPVSSLVCEVAQDGSNDGVPGICGKIVQVVLTFVSLGIGVFDSYTDWNVWVEFNRRGFVLLQAPDIFVYTWLAFTIMGTLLLVISLLIDIIAWGSSGTVCYGGFENHHLGLNSLTWAEILSFLNIMLEDLPILTLTFTYVLLRQQFCAGFDPSEDAGSYAVVYRDLFISGVITATAILYRTGRSFYRVCYSYNGCCCCKIPEKEQKLCPKGTCMRCCIVPYGIGLCGLVLLSMCALVAVGLGTAYLAPLQGILNDNALTQPDIGIIRMHGSDWNIARKQPFAGDSSILGNNVQMLIEDGHQSVIEAFHGNSHNTTYCLSYFEFHSKEISFNIANIDRMPSFNETCHCNRDSTQCDRYYENIFIAANVSNVLQDIQTLLQGCPLPVKPIQRNRDLHVNCSCNLYTVEHWVLW